MSLILPSLQSPFIETWIQIYVRAQNVHSLGCYQMYINLGLCWWKMRKTTFILGDTRDFYPFNVRGASASVPILSYAVYMANDCCASDSDIERIEKLGFLFVDHLLLMHMEPRKRRKHAIRKRRKCWINRGGTGNFDYYLNKVVFTEFFLLRFSFSDSHK